MGGTGTGVTKNIEEYTPKFPKMYKILMDTYSIAMTSYGRQENQIEVALMQACAVFDTLRSLKLDGVLPETFTKTFHEDITHVMGVVHDTMEKEKLTEEQCAFTFNIVLLQSQFNSK